VDPSGLLPVAFYDPTFENYYPDQYKDSPEAMWEWANDFGMYAFPMNSSDDVLEKLNELKEGGIDVTEVFFFDHGGRERIIWDRNEWTYGAEFGDDYVRIVEREDFWKDLGEAAPNASLHFRNCLLGAVVERLAELTGRTVTAVDGLLGYSNPFPNPDGPDYIFEGDLVAAHNIAGGVTSITLWQRYIGTTIIWEENTGELPYIVRLPILVPISNPVSNPY